MNIMNGESISENWNHLKDKIRERWVKFTDEDIDNIKDNFQSVAHRIQIVYGVAKEEAEREFDEFKKSVFSDDDEKKETKSAKASDDSTDDFTTSLDDDDDEDIEEEDDSFTRLD